MPGIKGRSGGRNRKPTALKLVEGNRGKRKINRKGPKPKGVKTVGAPAWLDKPAKLIFKNVVKVIGGTGILTKADVDAIAIYSDAYVELQAARRIVRK